MDVAAVVDESVRRVQTRYRVVASLVAGSAASGDEGALDVDLCVVVHDNVLRQAKLRVLDTPVDLFVCGMQRVRWELNRQQHLYLVPLFATGKYWGGDQAAVENLQTLARTYFERPVPLSESRAFAVRHRCHSLLRKFERECRDGSAAAAVMAGALVPLCIEAYFELHQVWVPGLRYRLPMLAERDPQAALAVQDVLAEPMSGLHSKPELVQRMVIALVGDAPVDEEVWVD